MSIGEITLRVMFGLIIIILAVYAGLCSLDYGVE